MDLPFGTNGITRLTWETAEEPHAVALQADGKIVLAGNSGDLTHSDFTLTRFNPDGSPDRSFGNMGRVVTNIPGRSNELARAIVLQPDGKIIVGASSGNGKNVNFTLLRYHPAGNPDGTFGSGGIRSTTFGGSPRAIALRPDGKILLAGDTRQQFETSEPIRATAPKG